MLSVFLFMTKHSSESGVSSGLLAALADRNTEVSTVGAGRTLSLSVESRLKRVNVAGNQDS